MKVPNPKDAADSAASVALNWCPADVAAWQADNRLKLEPGRRYRLVFWVVKGRHQNAEVLATEVRRIIERFAPGAEVSRILPLKAYVPKTSAQLRENLPSAITPLTKSDPAPVEAIIDYWGTDSDVPWMAHRGSTYLAGGDGQNACPVQSEFLLQEAADIGKAEEPEPGLVETLKESIKQSAKAAEGGASMVGAAVAVAAILFVASKVTTNRKAKT